MGRVDYVFNTWSRLTSETRTFSELTAYYTLSYEYNLAGGLTKLTDPFNSVVNYAFNNSGQLSGVTATAYPGVSTFASGMLYRAWGGLKHGSYQTASNSNSFNVDLSYDGRLLMTHYSQGGSALDYQHYNDGRVSFAGNLSSSSIFDRAYTYDHTGRMMQGLTGAEARGGMTADGPYKQTYGYDVFDNMTSRNNRFWSQPDDAFTATYTNDRNGAWNYDAAGNIKLDTLSHKYDVASRQVNAYDSVGFGIQQSYDGDGQPGKRIENRPSLTTAITTFYVRSSLLGGQVVSELSTTGSRANTHNTHVYVSGTEIAVYDSWLNLVLTKLTDPVIGHGLDPLGGLVGFADPFVQNPNTTYDSLHQGEALYFQDANPFDPGSGCEVDGLPTDCSRLARQLENGTVGIQYGAGGKILTQQIRGQFDPSIDGTIPIWVPTKDLDGSWTSSGGTLSISATSIPGHWVQGVGARTTAYTPSPGSFGQNPARASTGEVTTVDDLRVMLGNFYNQYQKKLARCLWQVFATDRNGDSSNIAQIMQRQTLRNAPVSNIALGYTTGQIGGQGRMANGTIYIASDLHAKTLDDGRQVTIQESVFRVYAHELGNYLSWLYTGSAVRFGTANGIRGQALFGQGMHSVSVDDDTGSRLEKCMWGDVQF